MKADALKTIRAVVAALIALATVWGLAHRSVVDDLRKRERAAHLTAWLALKDRFGEFDFNVNEKDGAIWEEVIEGTIGPGIDVARAEPLTVWTAWPDEQMTPLKLIRVTSDNFGARVYDVQTEYEMVPFSEYQVAVLRPGEIAIVQRGHWVTLRHLHDAVYGGFDPRAIPHRWRETRLALLAFGMEDRNANLLKSTEPAVAQVVRSSTSTNRSVLGFDVDSGLFFVGVGVAMLALVGPLVGPAVALARTRAMDVESAWYFALGSERRTSLLELGAMLSSVVVIAIPGAVGWLLWLPQVTLNPVESSLRMASTASLAVCTVVLACVFWELHLVRLAGGRRNT